MKEWKPYINLAIGSALAVFVWRRYVREIARRVYLAGHAAGQASERKALYEALSLAVSMNMAQTEVTGQPMDAVQFHRTLIENMRLHWEEWGQEGKQ